MKNAQGLLRDLRSAPRSWPCHTSSSQAGQGPRPGRKRKEKTQKDSQCTLPRVKVASQFLKRLGKLKVKAKQNTHMHQSNPITAFSKTHNHSLLLTVRKKQ